MREVEPTYLMALRFWWAWLWRQGLVLIPTLFLLIAATTLILVIVGKAAGMSQEEVSAIAGPMGFVLGLGVGCFAQLYIIRRLMTKGFGRFRIAIVEK